jgi:hypothetical protein
VRRGLWLAAGVAALAAVVVVVVVVILVLDPFSGDSDGGNGGESSLQKTLRRMVLQPEDVPEGFVSGDDAFITNDDAAADSTDPEARKALLESWGRLLGYEVAYQPTSRTADDVPVQGINVSASLYETEEGAGESFADAVKTAEARDWAANYAGLREFQQERIKASSLADEIVWLRLSGIQPGTGGPDALVTDDLIFFRIGTERGFLRVLASAAETQDRAHLHPSVESWLNTLAEHVRAALPEAPGENGG